MNWIKKYYEKILLAGALLLLIFVTAGLVLKIRSLRTDINATLNPPSPPLKAVAPVELTPYTAAIATLKTPAQWTNENAAILFPPMPVVTNVVAPPPASKIPPLQVEMITKRPFTLQFKAYLLADAQKNTGRSFQVNFISENRTFFVESVGMEIADRTRKTGYFIKQFNRKSTLVERPGIGGKVEEDCSELIVQGESGSPMTLVLGKLAEYPKRYARIRCPDKTVELTTGDTFESGGETYKVVDITDKEVIILHPKSGEKQQFILGAPAVREAMP